MTQTVQVARAALNGRRGLAAAILTSVAMSSSLSLLSLLAGCTSGTTPNCADAAEMCDPYEAGGDSGPADSGSAESSLHGG
jgi:hypothetical protein